MSAAHHLIQHPDQFDVTLVDAVDYCGGQAYSIPIDKEKHGADWLNQGVQGGSYIFHHSLTMFARQGHHADPVKLQVSFGKGDGFWSNVYPTKFLATHQKEVKRLSTMIKFCRMFEIFTALIPIKIMLKLFRFSYEFANIVALPMVALFLGTGNYAPDVPTIMLERLVTSPTYGMWYPGDDHSVASNLPPMVVFPKFSDFYNDWRQDLDKKGVHVRLSTEVTALTRRDKHGVTVQMIKRTPRTDDMGHNPNSAWVDSDKDNNADADAVPFNENYDEIIFCTLADTANRILKPTSSWRERKVLGSTKWANDVTVTHTDTNYMRNHYENFYNEEQAVDTIGSPAIDQTARNQLGKTNFKPMYYIKMYESDLSKLEMCFDCTNYQAQFPPDVPFENHVFQTIFLNKDRDQHLWSKDEIDKSKIIREDWWHQLCHSFTHYLFVVPFMMFLQGHRHVRYGAAWTMINAHEVAVMSGIAAAVSLGAEYPADLERDKFAFLSFRLYYLLAHGKWYKRKYTKKTKEGPGEDWASGLYGSVYKGPGIVPDEHTMWEEGKKKGMTVHSTPAVS